MRHLLTRIVLIVALLALCAWSIFPISEKIRLGKDLRGGVSLIYRISIPQNADRDAVMAQTIEVLKDRVNPKGVFDISFQPLGLDRIEIVMPLPSPQVQELNRDYQKKLMDLLDAAQIVGADLEVQIQAGRAVERYCGSDEASQRCVQIRQLQDAWQGMRDAREALATSQRENADADTLAQREDAVAKATIAYENLRDAVLAMSLDRSRVLRVLALPTERKPQKDPVTGETMRDAVTNQVLERPSPREEALAALTGEFPHAASAVQEVLAAYDLYQHNRTGLDDPEDLIRLLRGAGVLEFYITVDSTNPQGVNLQDVRRQLREAGPDNLDTTAVGWFPLNELKQWYETPEQLALLEQNPREYFAARPRQFVVEFYEGQYYMLLYRLPAKRMTHEDGDWTITSTYRSVDQLGRTAVAFALDTSGGTLMARLTGAHVQEPMAIVLDGEVYSAPTLQSQISSSGIITGSFSQDEINYLIRVLAAGSLEARLSAEPIAVNILGPTLGADNLRRGRDAFVISIIICVTLMLGYYFFAGFVADLGLLANGLIIFGIMAMIDGTYTLPGLAGMILSIAMAVDANVLIYERMREEIKGGETDLRAIIRVGYAKAMSAIIDGNLTNLIVCFVLLYTATAEVKGFALTMTIGVISTLFTALFVTRTILMIYTDWLGGRKISFLATAFPAVQEALQPNIRWIHLRRVFIPVSVAASVVSLVLVAVRGSDIFDTEFRGGVSATMQAALVDADQDGRPDVDERGEAQRLWLGQTEVQARLRAAGAEANPGAAADPAEAERLTIRRQLANALVHTVGETRTEEDRVLAHSFQVKVANPPGLEDEDAMTAVVVDTIVKAMGGQIDVSPSVRFAGAGESMPGAAIAPIESDDLGRVLNMPGITAEVKEFKGGVAIALRDLEPPITLASIEERIERMRNQPDFRETIGRRTRVVGLEAVDRARPQGPYRAAAVLVAEPNLSSLRVESDVWFQQLAQPEWRLVGQALGRQSSLQQVSSFSSAVAETLSAQAVVAVTLSLLGILIYIWVRFGSFRYSLAAVVSQVHDLVICLGFLAVSPFLAATWFGRELLGIEAFRIDLGVIAALLTIIGYSLNDTIVILDRIRENRGKRPLPTEEIVDRSVNQTFSRTILTGTTTILAVLVMYIEGGSGIRPFMYTLLVGLIVGTYSSVAIAAPLVFHRGTGAGGAAEGLEDEAAEAAALPGSRTPAGLA